MSDFNALGTALALTKACSSTIDRALVVCKVLLGRQLVEGLLGKKRV